MVGLRWGSLVVHKHPNLFLFIWGEIMISQSNQCHQIIPFYAGKDKKQGQSITIAKEKFVKLELTNQDEFIYITFQ